MSFVRACATRFMCEVLFDEQHNRGVQNRGRQSYAYHIRGWMISLYVQNSAVLRPAWLRVVNNAVWYKQISLDPPVFRGNTQAADPLVFYLPRNTTQDYADFGSGVYAPKTRLGRRLDKDNDR